MKQEVVHLPVKAQPGECKGNWTKKVRKQVKDNAPKAARQELSDLKSTWAKTVGFLRTLLLSPDRLSTGVLNFNN